MTLDTQLLQIRTWGVQTIKMPRDVRFLTMAVDKDTSSILAIVSRAAEAEHQEMVVQCFPVGHYLPEGVLAVGAVFDPMNGYGLVVTIRWPSAD